MKNISTALATHIASEVTSLATCWKLTRTDSTVLGFTEHDADISMGGVTYKAASGFTPSAIKSTSTLSVDNLEIEGMLNAASITEADIMAGIYDFAEIEIFMVNYNDLTMGQINLRRGWLGQVSLINQQFTAEVRGLTQRLSQTIGELFSPSCRATFGDTRCQINATTYAVTGAVTTVSSNQQFMDATRTETSGTYDFGKISFTSGANNGISMEVKEFINNGTGGGQITTVLSMSYIVAAGDTYSLTRGCDKTLATCTNSYNNIVNFRGEPFLSGLDKMLQTAGTL